MMMNSNNRMIVYAAEIVDSAPAVYTQAESNSKQQWGVRRLLSFLLIVSLATGMTLFGCACMMDLALQPAQAQRTSMSASTSTLSKKHTDRSRFMASPTATKQASVQRVMGHKEPPRVEIQMDPATQQRVSIGSMQVSYSSGPNRTTTTVTRSLPAEIEVEVELNVQRPPTPTPTQHAVPRPLYLSR